RIVTDFLKARRVPMRRVFFHFIPTNEAWARDHGPAFLLRKRRGKTQAAIVDWGFNAWGGKYPPWDADDNVPTRVAEELKLPVFYPGIVMEGGAVDFNGAGTVMTTTSCLLNKNRNKGLSKSRIEKYLRDYYGQTHFIWLGEGIEGDDTDGHIDDIARFVNPTTVVCALTEDSHDPDYAPLRANFELLRAATAQDGRKLRVVPLPTPGYVGDEEGRLPASYANFYISNTKVLVPIFGQPHDAAAVEVIQKLFPDRKAVGLMA